MAMNSLKDIYLDQLQDIWSANTQSLPVVTELGRAAQDEELSEALIAGGNGIADGIAEIEKLCNEHGIKPSAEHCKGMEGLVKEARAHGLSNEIADADVRDAAIIPQYQRMVHYALAGYGTLAAFANRLGLDSDAAVLKKCLDQTYDGDRRMTEIAMKGGVNKEATS
ncbi:ferritin-like domain-containing protein [Roseovarius nanhaiticus]|uniref:Ferritin-like metal-binding protein YciE n=1 Tax=Roseovarius nanhaiticus TaxID=573024 RepID=A0A1N7FQJ9_9RHOB|nr:ferritin-like domain-containing protein [Roseovarius nanhaiticus]SEK48396.1 Ferritin-like metal-binding protein YciE [Roseovarius nanhaiticus]SIS02525.1 Ferritin-like metal-binding protein YciE [Roseovarius nanhaiticus]